MNFTSVQELQEFLKEKDYGDSIILTSPSYLNAIIGVDYTGAIVYDFELMAEWLVENYDIEDKCEAYEYIEQNTIFQLSSIKGIKPIILMERF